MKQILLSILTLSLLSIITVNGQGVLPAESAFSLDPLITLISCLREDKPGYCLQRRALNFFESWLTSQGGDEDENPAEDETGERLPAGLSPYWSKIVDSIADKISGSMYGDGEEEEPEDVEDVLLKNQNNTTNQLKVKSRQGESQVEARGKYKKDKRVKVAMTIILLIIYFIKSTLFYMFDKLARTAIFAKLVMAYKAFVIIKLLELKRYLWWVKEEEKGQYHHGISVHDHVYEEEIPEHHHYDSSPPWSGGWPWHSRADYQQQLAYSNQIPINYNNNKQIANKQITNKQAPIITKYNIQTKQ